MGSRRVRFAVGLAAAVALAGAAVPADAAEVRSFHSFGISPNTNLRATSRVAPEGGSQCNGFSTDPTAEAASGSGWGFGSLQIDSGLSHPICVGVEIQACSTGGGQLTSASYNGTFDRTNALANYLGHGATGTYSFGIGAQARFTVVVMEMTEGAGCSGGWDEKITSDGPWTDAQDRPRIAGTPAIGGMLSGTDAVWKPNPSPTTVQQRWRRCDPAGANCIDIPGATSANYTVTDADLGHTLRFRNIATDPDGTSMSDSKIIEPFIPFEEHPTESLTAGDRVQNGALGFGGEDSHCGVPKAVPPVFNENFQFLFDAYPVTSILNEPVCLVARTVPGCMTGTSPNIYEPAFAPASGIATNYAANSGTTPTQPATASAILPPAGAADVVVTHGSQMGSCAQYALTIGADAPFASVRPTVDGIPAEGGTLTAGNGAWSGTPAFSHSWLSCDATGGNCTAIGGATGPAYTPTGADVGRRLRVRVTATQGRSVSADSEATGIVAAASAPPPPGGDRTPPKATLSLARTSLQRVVERGFIPVTVTCDEASSVALEAVVARRAARRLGGRRIAKGKGDCRPGGRLKVKAKLTRKARRGLRRRRSIAFTLNGTATDAAGNSGAVTKRARLKRRR